MISKFIQFNKRICNRIEPWLPQARENLFKEYVALTGQKLAALDRGIVVDVGGGKSCPFAKYRSASGDVRIIAVDVSPDEMQANTDVDEMRVADITRDLPFNDNEVDLLVSRSVLEHLVDLGSFARNSIRVMKPGGYTIHLFPAPYSPFALLNQALPHSFSKKLLYALRPESQGIGGFPAHYNSCSPRVAQLTFRKAGYEIIDHRVSYYQSQYFSFFVPSFLMSAGYELAIFVARLKFLAAYNLLVARKPEN